MTFSLTIQADTFDDFAAKCAALARQFNATAAAVDPVMPEIREPAKRGRPAKAAEAVTEAQDDGAAIASTEHPETEATVDEPDLNPASLETVEIEVPETGIVIPDKETDKAGFDAFVTEHIIPRVTKVVAKHGKPHMEAILKRFDVAKATLVPADKLPLLLKQMDEALEA